MSHKHGRTNMTNSVTKLQALPDPFDPENLRLDQSFVETSGVRKLLTTVPVRKPNNQDFIRIHPGETYRLTAAVIELKEDREIYLVLPTVAAQFPGECAPVTLYTGIWSVLKISGLPWRAKASSSVSTQNAVSIVMDSRHDSTRRLNQSSTTAR
jgi:hypothetical protein